MAPTKVPKIGRTITKKKKAARSIHLQSIRERCSEARWPKNDGNVSITSSTSHGSGSSDFGKESGLVKVIDAKILPQFDPESNLVINMAALEKIATAVAAHRQECCNLQLNNVR
jgi:hypothetical protein